MLLVVPAVLERRRRLRPLSAGLAGAGERVAELACAAGLVRPPVAMLGPTTMRDAFCYGVPYRYRLALPPAAAIRWRDRRCSTRWSGTSSLISSTATWR